MLELHLQRIDEQYEQRLGAPGTGAPGLNRTGIEEFGFEYVQDELFPQIHAIGIRKKLYRV